MLGARKAKQGSRAARGPFLTRKAQLPQTAGREACFGASAAPSGVEAPEPRARSWPRALSGAPGLPSSHPHGYAAGGDARSHGHRRAASQRDGRSASLFVTRVRARKQAAGSKDLLGAGRTDGGGACVSGQPADRGTGTFRSPPARRFRGGGHRPASEFSLGVTQGLRGGGSGGNVISSNGLEICWGDSSLRSASKGSERTVRPLLLPRAALRARGTQEAQQTGRMLGGETGTRATLPASCCPTGRKGGRAGRATGDLGALPRKVARESGRARGGESRGWRRG